MKKSIGWIAVWILTLSVLPIIGHPGSSALANCEQIDPLTVLPDDEVCPGWVRSGEAMAAYTLEQLMEIINGAAGLFEQYGFVAAAFQNYAGEVAGNPTEMTLSVFNQGTAENAEDLYNDPESGLGDPIGDWGGSGEARVRVAFGVVTFQFWEECFFASIVVISGGEQAVPHARCIAEAVVSLIQGATPTTAHSWGSIKADFQ